MRLRPPREDDAHAIARGCSDPDVARWTKVPSPYTLDDARAWIAMARLQLERGSELPLVLARTGQDRPVGAVALRVRTEPQPHGDIGYWVAATARGQGIASAGVRLLAAHALDALGLPFVEIALSPRNDASRGVARAAGFACHTVELREFKGALEEFEVWRLGPDVGKPSGVGNSRSGRAGEFIGQARFATWCARLGKESAVCA